MTDSIWQKISSTVSAIAPMLANAIIPGSGIGVALLSQALTGKKDASPDEILQAAQNPDAIVKLRQAELDYQLASDKIKSDYASLMITAPLQDTANARAREIELAKSGNKDNTPKMLAYMFITVYLILTCWVTILTYFYAAHPSDRTMSDMTNICMIIIGFYFGSSSSSREKDSILSSQIK